MSDAPPLLRLEGVTKDFGGAVKTRVLHGIDLELKAGEFVALVGRSGSGKSTLLNIIGLLDRPTGGDLWIRGERVNGLGDRELTWLRGRTLGFVFQFHHLIMALRSRPATSTRPPPTRSSRSCGAPTQSVASRS